MLCGMIYCQSPHCLIDKFVHDVSGLCVPVPKMVHNVKISSIILHEITFVPHKGLHRDDVMIIVISVDPQMSSTIQQRIGVCGLANSSR